MKPKSLLLMAGGMAMLGMLSFAAYLFYEPPAPPPPILGKAPAFELIDENGKPFSSESLVDKLWVVDFFFTTCPGPCPQMSAHMRLLNEKFNHHNDVNLVSITVDPQRDSPDALLRYGKRLDADFSNWHFLTGAESAIYELSVSGFKIGDPDALIRHSTKFVLVDRSGQIRGYFEGTDPEEIGQLEKAIKRLL